MMSFTAPRLPDWQVRLEAFYQARHAQYFEWGGNDCAHFAAAAIEAITGHHPAPPALRALTQATTSRGSIRATLRALAPFGGLNALGLHALASSVLGAPVPCSRAMVGDVVLLQTPTMACPAFGVCNGTSATTTGPSGMVHLPMAHALAAWQVG